MRRLQEIEKALASINDAVFQELCDSFLALRNRNYSAFSRTGSQSGKQKTIAGTPDSFFLLPNGQYIFVEHSTNVSEGVSKLKKDIEKCLDAEKTGIPTQKLEEIILCINFNLSPKETLILQNIIPNNEIQLRILMLDYLSIELNRNHCDLVHEYLGLALDTGQIVSIEKFIIEYNRKSKSLSTPLDNVFKHRDGELTELKKAIKDNDFVLLTGSPGVGKTKLALETIKAFLVENTEYRAYCVSPKDSDLLADLYQYVDEEYKYILFIDDANRLDTIGHVLGFYKTIKVGHLKVLMTVRDYAVQQMELSCHEVQPYKIEIGKFTDNQIKDIIEDDPLTILNTDYQDIILRIADGNPRLAIMTSLLAKEKQNIDALRDVSDLFERYFTTFVKDENKLAESLILKTLGIVSFFYTIPFTNKKTTSKLLANFEIGYYDFISAIDQLESMEILEAKFEYVKVAEQNLATFFFYKTFIKDDLLSFDTLLSKYFSENTSRFKDCVIPANNIFGYERVMKKLTPVLQNNFAKIETDDAKFKFLDTFWYYLQNESLEFIYNLTKGYPEVAQEIYCIEYEDNDFAFDKSKVIKLLGEYLRQPIELDTIIELGFEYVRKKPNQLPEWIHKIRATLTFDKEDYKIGYSRQKSLYRILFNGLQNDDLLLIKSFYKLSETFLDFTFQHSKGGRNSTVVMYSYTVPNEAPIHEFRKKIWDAVYEHYKTLPKESINLLKEYSKIRPDTSKELMSFDLPFVIRVMQDHLDPSSFDHCKYVHHQIRWWKENSIFHDSYSELKQRYSNSIYTFYLKIDWNWARGKEEYEFEKWRDYEKIKTEELRNSFMLKNEKDIDLFCNLFVELNSVTPNMDYDRSLEIIIDENCSQDIDIGSQFLAHLLQCEYVFSRLPVSVFTKHLNTELKAAKLWKVIMEADFARKVYWEFQFYENLDDSLLTNKHVNDIIASINKIDVNVLLLLCRYDRYLKFDSLLFDKILRIINDKYENKEIRIQLRDDVFNSHFDNLGGDFELITKTYLNQAKMHDHFVYEMGGFLKILNHDRNFLLQYIKAMFDVSRYGMSNGKQNLSFIWKVDNIEQALDETFEYVIEKISYFGISEHFCNSFFKNPQDEVKARAKEFLVRYTKDNFKDSVKMNVVVDIVRHSFPEMFEEILLLFISLTQDKELFLNIRWNGNGGSVHGDVFFSDIEMADWKRISSIVRKSDIGLGLIPIKKYLSDKIESCKRSRDIECERRFLEPKY